MDLITAQELRIENVRKLCSNQVVSSVKLILFHTLLCVEGRNWKKPVLIYSNHASMPKTTQLFLLEKRCNRKAKGSLYRQIVRITSQVLELERYNHATVIKLFTSKTCDLSQKSVVYNWSVVRITALVSLYSRCVALQDFEESHAGYFATRVLRQREALIRNKVMYVVRVSTHLWPSSDQSVIEWLSQWLLSQSSEQSVTEWLSQ